MMKLIQICITLFLIVLLSPVYGGGEDVYACKNDEDCVPAVGNCGEIISVNKQFLDGVLQGRKKAKDIILCSKYLPNQKIDKGLIIKCNQQKCEVVKKDISKSLVRNTANYNKSFEKLKKLEVDEMYYDCFKCKSYDLI